MYKFLLISKYLRKRTLILLSAGGMTVAVMVFIVIFSVLEGFGQNIVTRLRGTLADVVVEDSSGNGLSDYDAIMRDLRAEVKEVEVCSPYIQRIAMFEPAFFVRVNYGSGYTTSLDRGSRGDTQYGVIKGIDPENEAEIGDLERYLADGGFFAAHPGIGLKDILRPGENQVIIGAEFPLPDGFGTNDEEAHRFLVGSTEVPAASIEGKSLEEKLLNAEKTFGKSVRLKSSVLFISSLKTNSPAPLNEETFTVRGRFKTGDPLSDSVTVLMHFKDAQRLLGMAGREKNELTGAPAVKPTVSGINVRLKPGAYDRLNQIRPAIEAVLLRHGAVCTVRGWTDIQGKMIEAISVEKVLTFIILFCIVLSMGAGIFAIQSFSVVRHTRDIGIMKAVGATNGGVLTVFLGLSAAIGIIGAAFGVVLGIIISANVNEILAAVERLFGWELFPRETFAFTEIPYRIEPLTYALIAGVAIAVCVLAGAIPARMAARREAVKCLVVE